MVRLESPTINLNHSSGW